MTSEPTIPLVDLKAQLPELAEEIREGFDRVVRSTEFILGPDVDVFERAFAEFSGVEHCIGVGTGTDALELALRTTGVERGDHVIVPANASVASALAVERAGAVPVLVDCEPDHLLLDTTRIEARITNRTKAIMPVHLYGQCAPMEDIVQIAGRAGVAVVEDAARAQGARRNGRNAGSFGAVAGTSLHPHSNLGAFGDAGAVLTDSAEIDRKARALRNYGSETEHQHPETGFNSRLDTLQAVVLIAKLKRLAEWNEMRRAAAERYHELLADLDGVRLPTPREGNEHVWHLYVVRVPNRDEVLEKLRDRGIDAGIHYRNPIHLQGAFAHLGHGQGDFPVAEKAADEILSLPIFPEITPEQQKRVAKELERALG